MVLCDLGYRSQSASSQMTTANGMVTKGCVLVAKWKNHRGHLERVGEDHKETWKGYLFIVGKAELQREEMHDAQRSSICCFAL